MKSDTKKCRDIAKALRDAADAADKIVDLMEKEDYTEEEADEALKDFTWKLLQISMLQ